MIALIIAILNLTVQVCIFAIQLAVQVISAIVGALWGAFMVGRNARRR